jgi:hypothetical protein
MLNLNADKSSYLQNDIQSRLSSLVIFGFDTCQICELPTDLRFLQFEHLYTKANDLLAVYPACSECNNQKGNKDAMEFFSEIGKLDRFEFIANQVSQLVNVSDLEKTEMLVHYINQVFEISRLTKMPVRDGIIRLIVQPIPRQILSGLDFSNVTLSQKQVTANKLDRYFDLSKAIVR